MEANIFTNVVLPVALAVIMLGLGLTLTRYDFLRVVIFPKAFVIGLTCQMVLLPLAGFVIAKLFPMEPQLAVGVMILALCPAGATANLITYLARGDVALGITLTAFNSIIIIITTPILINLSLAHFLGETQEIRLPVLRTIIQVGIINPTCHLVKSSRVCGYNPHTHTEVNHAGQNHRNLLHPRRLAPHTPPSQRPTSQNHRP
jgi:BASS family bile acid:Na+ symporter